MTQDNTIPAGEVLISCKSVWKLYGANADDIVARHGEAISDEIIAAHGLIPAARDVSFDVRKGEIFVIMGLSGSGKSTILRCMTGLIEPTMGQLMVSGTDLGTASRQDLIEIRRKVMGMVFQDFALLPHLTVLDNVAFPLKVQGKSRAERHAKAREMVALVGLEGRESYLPHELSGGQQQRVGIARSLTTEPEIWFLDEPFSALDPLIRAEMQDEFLRLQNLLHKSIVFVTHDFDEAIRLADRIAIMADGRVVQIGTPEELITNPADDYVAKFTEKVPRSKVVTVRSVMGPVRPGLSGPPVEAAALVGDVAEQALAAPHALPVADAGGAVIGALDRGAVTAVLLNRSERA
ncbi:glycine betaine/L-proline ABC transporter ATP-binding protein [Roseovarius sp. SCSIO 43702]|uniref:quaternary amine ABC transporter ATP-binding protein n=1 Tax=Roseovarius sp. SCSIO 43702 TaxID=2823043 RepID=UPI00217619B3|nr:betaine/proline/choline family ABC transporter ATP-binding protein [Roseovarius sp. SCSIO 43702]